MFTLFMKKLAKIHQPKKSAGSSPSWWRTTSSLRSWSPAEEPGHLRDLHVYLKSSPVEYGIAPEPVFIYSVYV